MEKLIRILKTSTINEKFLNLLFREQEIKELEGRVAVLELFGDISQREIQSLTGLSITTVNKWCRSMRNFLRINVLEKTNSFLMAKVLTVKQMQHNLDRYNAKKK